jgi:hypothetical protein
LKNIQIFKGKGGLTDDFAFCDKVAWKSKSAPRSPITEDVMAQKNAECGTPHVGVRVLVFQDEGSWVAQCLEYDIGAQARDIDTLRDRLIVALNAELRESLERHGQPFAGIEPAPERFQLMWEHRARSVDVSAAPWMNCGEKGVNLELGLVA